MWFILYKLIFFKTTKCRIALLYFILSLEKNAGKWFTLTVWESHDLVYFPKYKFTVSIALGSWKLITVYLFCFNLLVMLSVVNSVILTSFFSVKVIYYKWRVLKTKLYMRVIQLWNKILMVALVKAFRCPIASKHRTWNIKLL